MGYKDRTQKVLHRQIDLENKITKLVEELYDIEVNKTIKADYQQQMKIDEKHLDQLLESISDTDKDIGELKLLQEQAEEKATNIQLLSKGLGSFNILMLPFILKSRTKRNVKDREKAIIKLDDLFMRALDRQMKRIDMVESKWPGLNKKNGNDFNLFLLEEQGTLVNAITQLS